MRAIIVSSFHNCGLERRHLMFLKRNHPRRQHILSPAALRSCASPDDSRRWMRVPQRAHPFFCAHAQTRRFRLSVQSKLRLDRRFVDDRPDLRNSFVAKSVEDVLSENDPPAVHGEAEKQTFRPAVEPEPARDVRRFADQKFDVEPKVRDLFEIALEHRAIAGEAERPTIVTRIVSDESMQIGPILPVEAGDVAR